MIRWAPVSACGLPGASGERLEVGGGEEFDDSPGGSVSLRAGWGQLD